MLEVVKLLVFYRPESEKARQVEEFIRDLQRQHSVDGKNLDILDVDSREGAAQASLYDVMSHPTFLVVADDGSIIKSWESGQFPLMNEIAAYTFSY